MLTSGCLLKFLFVKLNAKRKLGKEIVNYFTNRKPRKSESVLVHTLRVYLGENLPRKSVFRAQQIRKQLIVSAGT